MLTLILSLTSVLCYWTTPLQGASIDDYGAIKNIRSLKAAEINSEAFQQALLAANSSTYDRTVLIPAGNEYALLHVYSTQIHDITIQLEGTLIFSDEIQAWPEDPTAQLEFYDVHGVTVQGNGKIDGQGLKWWRSAYLGHDNRPVMFYFELSTEIYFTDVYLLNSPKFSINFKDCAHIIIHDITIFIDSAVSHGPADDSVTYPLNTDGIDIAAFNVTIYNTVITNYDDAIVPKPCRSNWVYCQCSGSILAYNNSITYSTGLTIGSVPPNEHVNCIRDVIFRDTVMYRPLKALYIKSNPGTSGTGIVENILFENIQIKQALWWTIYIGPQQQNQPNDGSDGTGCNFLFPFVPVCPTQPLVTIRNITFRNVIATETIPTFEGPGIILCDPANPCQEIHFDGVTNEVFNGTVQDILDHLPIKAPGFVFPTPFRSDDWKFEYLSDNAYGSVTGDVDPVPCFDESCWWDGESKH
jgi:polygalacturonase